jgi:hypothetical protein
MPIPLGVLAVAGAGAGATGSFDLLETTVLGSNAASVTFSSLGSYSAYKHLQVRYTVKTARTAFDIDFYQLTLNGVTTASYAYHHLGGNGSSVTSDNGANSSFIYPWITVPGNATTSGFGAGILDLLDFSSTSKNKTVRIFAGQTVSATRYLALASGFYNSTNAITSMTFTFPNANALTGSRFSLYGIK